MRDAVDFVTAPDPALLQQLGLDPLPYTGNARPDQGWFDDCRGRGVGPLALIQETYSTRSQEGFQAGVLDCQFAEARARDRGHAGSIAVVVSDGNYADAWDASEYGRGWASVASMPFFSYGAVAVCGSFNAGAGCSLGTWVPETWGEGTLISQVVGPSPVPDSDLNHVHGDYGGTQAPPAPTPATTGGKSMEIIVGPTFPSGHLAILVDNGGRECERWTSDGTDATEVLGIPKAALDWHNAGGRGEVGIVTIDAGPFARFLDNLKATTGDQPPGPTPEQLAAVQAVKDASVALAAAVAALG